MVHVSLSAKESFKTGLAMAIACGIAMAFGWANPYWALIAVAVVSLPTVGESLKKCVLRLGGTVAAGAVALGLFALFPQDRWSFIACIALYVGLCAYRITVARSVYFWFLSGYVSLLIAAAIIGTNGAQAFHVAVLRLQETALGILVYALVSVFLWPQRSTSDLALTVKNCLAAQAKALQQSFAFLQERDVSGNRHEMWNALETQLIGQLARRLDAAEMEQFSIREMRGWWRRLLAAFQGMLAAMDTWRESFPELRHLDLPQVLPELPSLRAALLARFAGLQALAAGEVAPDAPEPRLDVRAARLEGLSHVERMAVLTMLAALSRVEAASRELAEALTALKEQRRDVSPPPPQPAPAVSWRIDPEGAAGFLRGMVAVWLAALLWIVVDIPGHLGFVVFAGLFTLMGVMAPQMPWAKFLLFNCIGVVIAAVVYVFVMPWLSGYVEFSLLIVGLATAITYISWHPRLTMLRLAGVVPFIMMTNIQNHQGYDFASFLNNAAAMAFGILFAAILSHFPYTTRPERVVVRLMSRYFGQAQKALARLEDAGGHRAGNDPQGALAAMQKDLDRIGGWSNSVDFAAMPEGMRQGVADIVVSLHAITARLRLLLATRREKEPTAPPVRAALLRWNRAIAAVFGCWSDAGPQPGASCATPAQLETTRQSLETDLEALFACAPDGMVEDAQALAVYRRLGGYRAVYEAVARHAALVAAFDWERWSESRF